MLSGWFQPLRLGSRLSYPYSNHRPRVPTLHTETGGVWRRTPWPSWNPLDWASAICVHPYLPLPRQRCHSCPQHTTLLLCLHFVTPLFSRDREPSFLLLSHLLNSNNFSNLTFKIRVWILPSQRSLLQPSYHFTTPWVRVRHPSQGIFPSNLTLVS